MPELHVLTQSSLGNLQSCEEKFRLRYLEGLRPMETKPHFSVGTGFHAGVELVNPDAGVQALREARGEPYTEQERDSLVRDSAIVYAMVEGALARWSSWPERKEVAFQVPLVNPLTGSKSRTHDFGGVLDGLWMSEDSLLELKTTSRLDRDYIARLDIDFQVTSYLAAASMLTGRDIRRMVYRVARKPSIRQRKNETPAEYGERVIADYRERPDFYFSEVIVTRTEQDLERWRWEVWTLHQRVLDLKRGDFPIRNTRACLDFGRCAYFELCTGQIGPEAFRVEEDANPELPEIRQTVRSK